MLDALSSSTRTYMVVIILISASTIKYLNHFMIHHRPCSWDGTKRTLTFLESDDLGLNPIMCCGQAPWPENHLKVECPEFQNAHQPNHFYLKESRLKQPARCSVHCRCMPNFCWIATWINELKISKNICWILTVSQVLVMFVVIHIKVKTKTPKYPI